MLQYKPLSGFVLFLWKISLFGIFIDYESFIDEPFFYFVSI